MSGRTKATLSVLAGLTVVAVTVLAVSLADPASRTEPALTLVAPCTEQCADCPAAGSQQCAGCPAAGTTQQQEGTASACETEARASVSARCIACGRCVQVAPEAFSINPQTGKAEIEPGAPADAIARGAAACPVGAVHQ
ncbi:MAG: ferredoxin [Armatimonadota bacterium]